MPPPLADEATAERWAARRPRPDDVLGGEGDVVVMFHVVGDGRDGVALGFRHIAARYPGQRWVMYRHGRRSEVTWGRLSERVTAAPDVGLV